MSLADIKRLAQNIHSLPTAIRRKVAEASRKEMQSLLDEEFEQGIDPAGEEWKPLAESTRKRGRTPPPLTDTRTMRGTVKAVRVGLNVAIDADFPAQAHQEGYPEGNLPRRAIWPDEDTLPERYRVPIEYATTAVLSEEVKRAVK